MNTAELEAFRLMLVERRDLLIAEGDFAIDPVVKEPSTKVDEDEAPLTEMSQVIASRRNKERAQEINGILNALRRIETDPEDFGVCDHCGEDINHRRLKIMPWASYCVKCQAKVGDSERGTRRRHLTDYS